MTTAPPASLLARAAAPARAGRQALADAGGRWSYGDLIDHADLWGAVFADALSARERTEHTGAVLADAPAARDHRPEHAGAPTPPTTTPQPRGPHRIAYLAPPGRDHVAVLLGVWRAGAIAVPLATSHPLRELHHVLDDARPAVVVIDPAHPLARPLAASAAARRIAALDLRAPSRPDLARAATTPRPSPPPADHPALIIYTSGTTGRPKGVLTTHGNVSAQIAALVEAWEWRADDRILHTLPLHHIHGIVNALACALWSGAACEFGDSDPASTWDRLASGEITLFMSVPTVYRRLVRAWDAAPAATRRRWSRGAAGLRLMVSGSAALPVATLERWREITGHTLLERYGMTEIGMALSNPLHGRRRPGHVGRALPGVELRIVDEGGRPVARGEQGEIVVRGPQLFREYWGLPDETRAAFQGGWFLTGDEGRESEDGTVRILGRRSVDIVKTGGYKVSALEVEDLYRTHPAVRDIAVVGVPDEEWGERLQAAWVPAGAGAGERGSRTAGAREDRDRGAPTDGDDRGTAAATASSPAAAPVPSAAELREWGKERLAPYKVPHVFLAVESLPRNAMGKVRKTAVRRILRG